MPPVSGVRSTVDGGAEQPRLHDDGHEGVGIEIALQRQRGRNRRWRLHDWLRKQLRAQKVFLLDGLVDAVAVEDGFVGCEHNDSSNGVSDIKNSRRVAGGVC